MAPVTQPAVTWPHVDHYRVREAMRRAGARFEAERVAAITERNRLAVAAGATICDQPDVETRKPCTRLQVGGQCPKHPTWVAPPRIVQAGHQYGPHDPGGVPSIVKVYTRGDRRRGVYPMLVDEPIPGALVRQRATLNRLAHERSLTV